MNELIVRLKETFLVFLLLSSSIVTLVLADWGTIPVIPGVSVYEPGQKAIIAWNGQEEILILSADVASTANTTVLQILPLPSSPMTVKKASLESFYVVEELIWYHAPPPPPNGYWGNETDEVRVVFHEQIGMHDITVVEAQNVSEFIEWMDEFLLENGISEQVSLGDFNLVIEDYMLRGFHFYVLDLLDLSSDQRSVEPVLYKFETNFLYYPLLITSPIGGDGNIILFLITEDVIESGYYPLRKAQYYGPDILEPIQFEVSNEELSLIDPNIGELFEDKAWLTALVYEGPLNKLTEDIMITLPRESLPRVSFFPHEIYLDGQTNNFIVSVNIENLQASHRFVGVELQLEYDTTVLTFTEVTEGEFLNDFEKYISYTIEMDVLIISILLLPPWTRFPEGNGTLVALGFIMPSLVENSTIHLSISTANETVPPQDDYCHIVSTWNRADLNYDGKVNVLDLSVFAKAFATHPGQYRWNTNVDTDRNRMINIIDAAMIAKNFGKTWEYPGSVTGMNGGLELQMAIEKVHVDIGDTVKITLTLKNLGNETLMIWFGSSQSFDLYLYYMDVPVAKWSDGMVFLMLVWESYLEPNETYTRTLNWDFYLYNWSTGDRYPPQPGKYELVGVCVGHFLETSPAVVTSKLPIELSLSTKRKKQQN